MSMLSSGAMASENDDKKTGTEMFCTRKNSDNIFSKNTFLT
jgi:hypothetical protein